MHKYRDENIFGKGDNYYVAIDHGVHFIKLDGGISVDDVLPLKKDAVEFEGKKYAAFNNFEKHLANLYSNYMTLPLDIYPKHQEEMDEVSREEAEMVERENEKI